MKTIFGISSQSIEEFEESARRCADCGATHLVITENLPLAHWQFDTPGDPYPAWYAHQPGLLKIFPPVRMRPFIDAEYASGIRKILQQRCQVLRKYNLRGAYFTTEPQVLPESLFQANPEWRGPRVDQPNRSRVARFAPCVAHPEVLELYSESMKLLLESCPEIDTLLLLTIDSGSGLCWAPSLYPGANGCSRCSPEDLEDRAVRFIQTLANSGKEMGIQLNIDLAEIEPRSWMRKTFPDPSRIAGRLEKGLALNHREGPDGSPFSSSQFSNLFFNAFYPAVGIPRPVDFLRKLSRDHASRCGFSILSFNDGLNTELNIEIYKAFQKKPSTSHLAGLLLLREVAENRHGKTSGEDVLELWLAIDDAEKQLLSLDFGPFLFMGGILARWITRPFVPFPEELDTSERSGFFPFLFQARDEASALNLADIQAMRMFEGWGARLIVEQTVAVTLSHVSRAQESVARLRERNDAAFEAVARRLDLLSCLLENACNAVAYQAQLDRMKASIPGLADGKEPPPLGASSHWDASDLTRIARAEVDNTVKLLRLIEAGKDPIIDMLQENEPESIIHFSSHLPEHLRRKVRTMNSKWMDYNRLVQPANP